MVPVSPIVPLLSQEITRFTTAYPDYTVDYHFASGAFSEDLYDILYLDFTYRPTNTSSQTIHLLQPNSSTLFEEIALLMLGAYEELTDKVRDEKRFKFYGFVDTT